jgi:FkbM family methyltransferase
MASDATPQGWRGARLRMGDLLTSFNRLAVWNRDTTLGKYAVRVPTFDRWLYVKLHALHAMGRKEMALLSGHVKPGMRAVDIGANIGLYTILLAELVGTAGRVYAFEPDPILFDAALKNIRRNLSGRGVQAYNLALGSNPGHAILYRSAFNSGDNRLTPSPTHRGHVPTEVGRLDDILEGEPIDWIKIDVQGWELEALRGMNRTLKENPRVGVYFEFWPLGLRRTGEQPVAALDFLRAAGFSFFQSECKRPLSNKELEAIAAWRGSSHVNLFAKRV